LLNQTDMTTRDQHILATIEKELALKKRVLVVYGGSHWTTLSQVLEKKYGKPVIKPFLE
jgi:Asp/Glu/hydantoin racemase